jgi:protein dithiol:quinone oxidoreductase
MRIPGRRALNVLAFLGCAAMMAFALYAQHVLLLDPCPLCILQRVAVIALGLLFLLAALHDPHGKGRQVYTGLIILIALTGIGVAAWHVRMQHLPASEVPTCGPGLDYMLQNFPLGDALRMVFHGSGECATIVWQFLGLSMPGWVLLCLLGLGSVGAWNNLRRPA